MTPESIALTIVAVQVLFLAAYGVGRYFDRRAARKPRRWQEWQNAEQWDRYPRVIDVNVRPLEERDYGDEDSPQQ